MPVHITTIRSDLRLTLTSNGEVLDTQLAATPREANRVAIMMIASRDAFDAGDTLTCTHADEFIAKSYRDDNVRVHEIVTSCWAKPIPVRQFDWQAHYDGDEPNDNGQMKCGHGRTEQEAIDDLLEIGGAA
jgi:hypothetical protein